MFKQTGKLIHKDVKTGVSKKTGKPWTNIEFAIDITGNSDRENLAVFKSMKGGVIEFIQDTNYDTLVTVEFAISGRKGEGQWEGRYFCNLDAINVQVNRETGNQVVNIGDHNGVGQANQMYGNPYQTPPPPPDDNPEDDLPF